MLEDNRKADNPFCTDVCFLSQSYLDSPERNRGWNSNIITSVKLASIVEKACWEKAGFEMSWKH